EAGEISTFSTAVGLPARFAVLRLPRGLYSSRPATPIAGWKFVPSGVRRYAMAETGARRQRSEETGLSRTDRGRQSESLERSWQGGFYPSIFSLGPGEFFTMSPITLMRRLTEDLDRAFSGLGRISRRGTAEEEFTWAPSVEVTQSGNNLV